jgi:hypothetical protein
MFNGYLYHFNNCCQNLNNDLQLAPKGTWREPSLCDIGLVSTCHKSLYDKHNTNIHVTFNTWKSVSAFQLPTAF